MMWEMYNFLLFQRIFLQVTYEFYIEPTYLIATILVNTFLRFEYKDVIANLRGALL